MRHGGLFSAPSIVGHDMVERTRARFDTANDRSVERQRTASWAAFGVYVAVAFIGLPVSFVIVAVVRLSCRDGQDLARRGGPDPSRCLGTSEGAVQPWTRAAADRQRERGWSPAIRASA